MPTTFIPVNINPPLGRIEHRIGDDVLDTEAVTTSSTSTAASGHSCAPARDEWSICSTPTHQPSPARTTTRTNRSRCTTGGWLAVPSARSLRCRARCSATPFRQSLVAVRVQPLRAIYLKIDPLLTNHFGMAQHVHRGRRRSRPRSCFVHAHVLGHRHPFMAQVFGDFPRPGQPFASNRAASKMLRLVRDSARKRWP
jgi:hypothetical protein